MKPLERKIPPLLSIDCVLWKRVSFINWQSVKKLNQRKKSSMVGGWVIFGRLEWFTKVEQD